MINFRNPVNIITGNDMFNISFVGLDLGNLNLITQEQMGLN